MCLAAIYWARLSALYYANCTEDATGIGFDDGFLYREVALPTHERSLPTRRILPGEALVAFEEWTAKQDRVEY